MAAVMSAAIKSFRLLRSSRCRYERADVSLLPALTPDLEVLPPRAPALAYWPFLALPPFAIAGFALHQRLSRRRTPK